MILGKWKQLVIQLVRLNLQFFANLFAFIYQSLCFGESSILWPSSKVNAGSI